MVADPLRLPCDPVRLAEMIADAWGDHGDRRGVARTSGVDPGRVTVGSGADGKLYWKLSHPGPARAREPETAARALSALADALEDRGLVVDRTAGLRVVGFAAVMRGGPRWVEGVRLTHPRLVRIIDLDITDPRRSAHFDRVREEWQARMAPMPPERAKTLARYGR